MGGRDSKTHDTHLFLILDLVSDWQSTCKTAPSLEMSHRAVCQNLVEHVIAGCY